MKAAPLLADSGAAESAELLLMGWRRCRKIFARRNVWNVGRVRDPTGGGVIDTDAVLVEQRADGALKFDS